MFKKYVPAGLVTALVLALPNLALAQEGAKAAATNGWGHASAALAIAIAAAAGAIGQAKTAVAACEGIARNPGAEPLIFKSSFLALVLIESLVIYALVIAFNVKGL